MTAKKCSVPTNEKHNKVWDDLITLHDAVSRLVGVAAISTSKMVVEVAKLPVKDPELAKAIGKDIDELTGYLKPLVARINTAYALHKDNKGGTGDFEKIFAATELGNEYNDIQSSFTQLLPLISELQENLITYAKSTTEKK